MNTISCRWTLLAFLLLRVTSALAHDTWVETNTNIVRAGDAIHIDLKLGNHGNEHRDFKQAGKVTLETSTLQVLAPNNQKYDLKSTLIDTGYSPQEGYWTAPFVATQLGLYVAAHTYDNVMSYAPERSIKSAKTFWMVSRSLDRVPLGQRGFERRLGHPLELVPETSPIAPMGPGVPLAVRLFFKGKPLSGCRVSFVPRRETLKAGFDARYEGTTNANGRVHFTPKQGDEYLIVAHHKTSEKGKGYDFTQYAATLTLFVPQVCPCCG